MPTIKTCSVEPQIPQWLSHDLSHLGSSPTTLTVRRKELRVGVDGCISPPPSFLLSVSAEILVCCFKIVRKWQREKKKKKKNNQIVFAAVGVREKKSCCWAQVMTQLSGSTSERRGPHWENSSHVLKCKSWPVLQPKGWTYNNCSSPVF